LLFIQSWFSWHFSSVLLILCSTDLIKYYIMQTIKCKNKGTVTANKIDLWTQLFSLGMRLPILCVCWINGYKMWISDNC
jgi:pyrroloquinoline quinone (PQQ) biosynthesis protein C